MRHPSNKRLLTDVLAEETDAGFREALLGQTLHLARRRRQFRKARQVGFTSLVFIGLAISAFHLLAPKSIVRKPAERPYLLVTTGPLPASAIVSTTQDASIAVIATSPAISVVATTGAPAMLHPLDDDELLSLLPSPALLVRRGPHLVDLVFSDPKAEQALFPN